MDPFLHNLSYKRIHENDAKALQYLKKNEKWFLKVCRSGKYELVWSLLGNIYEITLTAMNNIMCPRESDAYLLSFLTNHHIFLHEAILSVVNLETREDHHEEVEILWPLYTFLLYYVVSDDFRANTGVSLHLAQTSKILCELSSFLTESHRIRIMICFLSSSEKSIRKLAYKVRKAETASVITRIASQIEEKTDIDVKLAFVMDKLFEYEDEQKICAFCTEKNATKTCSRCLRARYCSEICQKRDYKKNHKNVCKALCGFREPTEAADSERREAHRRILESIDF